MITNPLSVGLALVLFSTSAATAAQESESGGFETVGSIGLEHHIVRVEIGGTGTTARGRLAFDLRAADGSLSATTYVENASTQLLSASQWPAAVWTAEHELLIVAARDGIQLWDVSEPSSAHIVGALSLVDIDAPEVDHPWQFEVQFPWLFAIGSDGETLQVVDVHDPVAPELVDESYLSNYVDGEVLNLSADGEWLELRSVDRVGYANTADPRRPVPAAKRIQSRTDVAPRTRMTFTFLDSFKALAPDRLVFDALERAGNGADGKRATPGATTFQGTSLTVAPLVDLAADTTYGVRFASRATAEPLWFSTGHALSFVPIRLSSSGASTVGEEAFFAALCEDATGEWSFDFGDGSTATPWSSEAIAFHTFDTPGLHRVTAALRHGERTSKRVIEHAVVRPETALPARKASTVIYDAERARVWCVNPDNDTVSCVDHTRGVLLMEIPVGKEPRSIALADDRTLWVTSEEAWSVTILDADSGKVLDKLMLPYACRPFGLVHASDGTTYIATLGTQEVLRYDTTEHTLLGRLRAGGPLRGLAVSGDASTVLATRFISPQANGELIVASPADFEGAAGAFAQPLAKDAGPDTRFSGRGVPNHVADVAITPDGRRAWIAAKKDNTSRGLFREGQALSFCNTVRPMAAVYDLAAKDEVTSARIDFGARDFPVAVAFSPRGEYGFMAMRGSRSVEVFDPESSRQLFSIENTGVAPIGLCVDTDRQLLVVHNFLTRDLAVYSLEALLAGTDHLAPLIGRVRAVTVEILRGPVLPGKQIFHTAADDRMSRLGHVSCSSCHFDSGQDGRVWDFTDRGEGLRNTISLQGRQGTAHGLMHWSANFNEVQDFEQDMRLGQGGRGFMADHLWRASRDALGYDKRGLSPELDSLNSYVTTFDRFPPSPYRNQDGSMTGAGLRGRATFERLECWQCHGGRTFTDFQFGTLHDVGTIQPHSGSRIGDLLPGIDTPTLRGVWETAPYFHDGSAATLMDVLERTGLRGGHEKTAELALNERQDLVAYLMQLDGLEPPTREAVRQQDAIVAFETLPQRAGLEDAFVLTANDWPVVQPRVSVGGRVYGDSAVAFTSVPAWLAPAYRMVTVSADADEEAGTDAPVLELATRYDVTITVGLDVGAGSVPAWLAGFTEHADRVAIDGATFRLFQRRIAANTELSLGANPAAGLAMYLIFLQR